MSVKKFRGDSIKEARLKARESLGHNFTVVETKDAEGRKQAWIHVLNEDANEMQNNLLSTYNRGDLFPKALTKIKDTVNDSLKLFESAAKAKEEPQPAAKKPKDGSFFSPSSTKTPRLNKALSGTSTSRTQANSGAAPPKSESDTSVHKEVKRITRRMDELEQLISDQIMGINSRYLSHPAFQQLLAAGVPRTMIIAWFNALLRDGTDPYDPRGSFSQRLAEKVKKTLSISPNTKPASLIFFTGAAGAGKSSLIMKLARHASFLPHAKCVLISVCLSTQQDFYSPLEAFTSKYDVAHHIVHSPESLKEVAEEKHFDHLLIEMPSSSQVLDSSLPDLKNFHDLFNARSCEVHRIINTTQNQRCLTIRTAMDRLFPATHLDFTHLDETSKVGHVLPLMQKFDGKARYLSAGPRVPEDIAEFKPGYFAKQLLI